MQDPVRPPSLGHVLLTKALADRDHNLTEAEEATGSGQGTIGRVLDGKRGVGMDLAAKIARAYPEVVIASWAEDAPEDAVMAAVPRGKRRHDRDSDAAPEAP